MIRNDFLASYRQTEIVTKPRREKKKEEKSIDGKLMELAIASDLSLTSVCRSTRYNESERSKKSIDSPERGKKRNLVRHNSGALCQ